jgi:hypothetical protein
MHMHEPRVVYFMTDLALVRRVLHDNKVMMHRAIASTRRKATDALKDLARGDQMELEENQAPVAEEQNEVAGEQPNEGLAA